LSKDENALWILNEIREKYQDLTLISEAEEKSIYQILMRKNPDISPELLGVVVGAINSNIYFQRAPIMMASNYLFDNPSQRKFLTAGGQKFRLNQEYIRQIFDKNNIIALKKKKFSEDNDDIVYIFNMSKVQTLEKLDTETSER